MRRHAQFDTGKQIPLALDPTGDAAGGAALFAAYTQLEISRRLSFQQVMADRAYAIGVRNLADAIARRRAPYPGPRSMSRSEFRDSGNARGDR